MLQSADDNKYEEAYQYLKTLRKLDHKYEKDYNLYLYLLSNLIALPEEDREYAKVLDFDDVRVSFNNDQNNIYTELNNKMRYEIMDNNYGKALKIIQQNVKLSNRILPRDILVRSLVFNLYHKEISHSIKILELVKDRKFEEIVFMLEQEQTNHRLSRSKDLILEISYDILDMINENKILEVEEDINENMDIDGLIYKKHYQSALEMLMEKNKDDLQFNVIHQLLTIAIEEMDRIKEIEAKKQKISFTSLTNNLLNQDYDAYFEDLKSFLSSKGKNKYHFIFRDLVRISTLEQDDSYTLPMMFLIEVMREDFKFSMDFFLQHFYQSMSLNNLASAKGYLNILENAINLSDEEIPIAILTAQLRKKEVDFKESVAQVEKEILEVKPSNEEKKPSLIESSKPVLRKKKVSVNKDLQEEEKKCTEKYLQEQLEKLDVDHPVQLLNSMTKDMTEYVLRIVSSLDQVVARVIKIESEDRIFIKHQEKLVPKEEYKETLREASNDYRQFRLRKSNILYNQLICSMPEPRYFMFESLGYLCIKTKSDDWKKKATMYLQISDALLLEENEKLYAQKNHEDFIFQLNYLEDEVDRKDIRGIRIQENDFYDDVRCSYGIDNLEEILNLVKEEHIDIEDISNRFALTNEDIDIIKLVLARDCYCNRNFKQGDKIFKQVEQSKEKTPFIKSLMSEIQTNKKLYPYRTNKHITSYEKTKKN